MDKEQEEMQFLGFFGIYVESYKLIISCRKIFSKITLSLILPLSFIYLLHMEISSLLFRNIIHTEVQYLQTKSQKLNHLLSNEVAYFWLFKAAYFTLFLIFSLLSTSAVVYTIACIYTARELSFHKVMTVVPKVWKRLMVTFLCMFVSMFVYNAVTIFLIVVCALLMLGTDFVDAVLAVLLVFYFVGFLYMTIIWHLASVVSVLEENYGFKAMMKSKNLIKGKLWVATLIFLKLIIGLAAIHSAFQRVVVHGGGSGTATTTTRVLVAIVCFLLLSNLILFGLVVQTVIYFVCKSYHHENIDKSALSDHLEVYLGEYVPLKAKDVQLEQFRV